MIQSLYSAANGMKSQQQNIDVIANNVANIDADGYKKARFDFKDALYGRMISPVDNSVVKNLQRGTGAVEYQTRTVFQQGALTDTGRKLDFALEGEGFFTLMGASEEDDVPVYTRNGNFYISSENGALVAPGGYYVLNDANDFIYLPEGTDVESLSVSSDGTLTLLNTETGMLEEFTKLGIVNFLNPPGLSKNGTGHYMETENSGPPEESNAAVLQGKIEKSNVDYAEEATRLIRAQRAYQLASRCIQTADAMAQTCNAIRG